MDKEYAQLIAYYRKMFGMVDAFHFNSQNTADVYGRYLNIPTSSKVIPITHGGITDQRRKKKFDDSILRLGFIGSGAPYKGLPMLKKVIEKLNQEGLTEKFLLAVYGGRTGIDDRLPNVFFKGKYSVAMMAQVFDEMDLLIVPSIWNETFSLVTLEALSYGTPVLVSNHVGAKDIVAKYDASFVFETKDDLYNILKRLADNKSDLVRYNEAINTKPWSWSIEQHAKDIVQQLYQK